MKSVWKFLTSLRLTVVCLAYGIFLVFFGTIAQVEEGLYAAQDRWFKGFYLFWNPNLFGWRPFGHELHLPLPGGYTVGVLLLVNLIAAHIKRFQWTTRKLGIHLTHFGIIMLLVGQLVTDMASKESHLSLREGEAKNYSEDHRDNELVFLTDGDAQGQDRVVAVPDTMVATKGDIVPPGLPILVRVKDYQPNCNVFGKANFVETVNQLTRALATVEGQFSTGDALVQLAQTALENPGRVSIWQDALAAVGETDNRDIAAAARRVAGQKDRADRLAAELRTRFRGMMMDAFSRQRGAAPFIVSEMRAGRTFDVANLPVPATQGFGPQVVAFPLPESKESDKRNLPYAVLEVLENGQSLGTWIVSPFFDTQALKAGGKDIRIALRPTRYYYPFSVKLLKTTHEIYPGTATEANPAGIPKNFQSRVQIKNPETKEEREVEIYMNNPLRYAGLTYFQYQMGKDEMAGRDVGTSTLQVVRNPGWLTPYFGCIIVGLGMTYQFLFHLVGFINKRGSQAAAAGAVVNSGRGGAKRRPAESPVA